MLALSPISEHQCNASPLMPTLLVLQSRNMMQHAAGPHTQPLSISGHHLRHMHTKSPSSKLLAAIDFASATPPEHQQALHRLSTPYTGCSITIKSTCLML